MAYDEHVPDLHPLRVHDSRDIPLLKHNSPHLLCVSCITAQFWLTCFDFLAFSSVDLIAAIFWSRYTAVVCVWYIYRYSFVCPTQQNAQRQHQPPDSPGEVRPEYVNRSFLDSQSLKMSPNSIQFTPLNTTQSKHRETSLF